MIKKILYIITFFILTFNIAYSKNIINSRIVIYQENPILDIIDFSTKKTFLSDSEKIKTIKILIKKINNRIKFLKSINDNLKTIPISISTKNNQSLTTNNKLSKLNNQIDNINSSFIKKNKSLAIKTTDLHNTLNGDNFLKSSYYIKQNLDIKPLSITNLSKEDQKIWEISKKVFSNKIISNNLNLLKIYNKNIDADGENFTVASVSNSTNNKWALNINLNYLKKYPNDNNSIKKNKKIKNKLLTKSRKKDIQSKVLKNNNHSLAKYTIDEEYLIKVLTHELAHILSLNKSQFKKHDDTLLINNECQTLIIDSMGCLKKDSAIFLFQQKFWDEKDKKNSKILNKYLKNKDYENFEKKMIEYYGSNQKKFTSPYATSSFMEDFAESYLTYVFIKDYADYYSKDNYKQEYIKKALFMDQFPELKKEKKYILSNFKKITKSMKKDTFYN